MRKKVKSLSIKFAFFLLVGSALFTHSAISASKENSLSLPPITPGFQENDLKLISHGKLGDFQARIFSDFEVVPADGETEATIKVQLLDSDSAPVPERLLTLILEEGDGLLIPEEPVTDKDGFAVFTYRAGKIAITNRLILTDTQSGHSLGFSLPTSLSAVLTVRLVDPHKYQQLKRASALAPQVFDIELFALPDTLVADGVSISRLTARLTYKDGSPAAGFPVVFRIVSGYGKIIADQELTGKDGIIEAYYQAGEQVGSVIIEAVEQTTGAKTSVEISVLKAGPAKILLYFDTGGTLDEEPAILPADGFSRIEIVAKVLSVADTPVADVEVEFKLKNELGVIHKLQDKTDAAGEIRAVFVAGSFVGTEEITAFIISDVQD